MTNESESETTTPAAPVPDIGPMVLAQTLEQLGVEPEWRMDERSESTIWEHRVRQRIWVVGPHGEGEHAWWQLRSEIPFRREVPDVPETWELVARLNREAGIGAWVFDRSDGTIRCQTRMEFEAGLAWWVPAAASRALGLALAQASVIAGEHPGSLRPDTEPHPVAGLRSGPGPIARWIPVRGRDRGITAFEGGIIKGFAEHLRTMGTPAVVGPQNSAIAPVGDPGAPRALLLIGTSDDRWTGPGVMTNLVLAGEHGPRSAAWIANELNLRMAADPASVGVASPFGGWIAESGMVVHRSVTPASVALEIVPAGPSRFIDADFRFGYARHEWAEPLLPELITAAAAHHPEEAAAFRPSESLAAMLAIVVRGLATDEDRPSAGTGRKADDEPGSMELAREGRIAEAEARAGEDLEQGKAFMRRAHRWRGGLRARMERWGDALDDADAVLALAPEETELATILADRAFYAHGLGRYAEGLAAADRALAIRPLEPSLEATILVNRGINLSGLGMRDEAVAGYRRALEIDPDCAMAVYNLACDEAVRGAYPAALTTLRRAIGMDAELRLLSRRDADFDGLAADPVHGPQLRALIGAND